MFLITKIFHHFAIYLWIINGLIVSEFECYENADFHNQRVFVNSYNNAASVSKGYLINLT
jgi:hypothetical protein